MNLSVLEYMIAISEEKSLSRAADRLMISQPALTKQLKKLETQLGTRLFVRQNNQLVLTDAGYIFVNGARSSLNIYEQALIEIRKLRRSGRKQLTLVYNTSLLPELSTAILPAFRDLHPDTTLSAIDGNSSIAKDYLLNSMTDLAVIASKEPAHTVLEYIPLRDDELLLMLPKDHPAIPVFQESGVDFSLLQNEHFILNQVNSHFRSQEQEILARYDFTPNVLCEISDLNASQNMVRSHKGIAFLPRSMWTEQEGFTCFPLSPPAVFHTMIAYHKGISLSAPVRDLILLLLKNCGEG